MFSLQEFKFMRAGRLSEGIYYKHKRLTGKVKELNRPCVDILVLAEWVSMKMSEMSGVIFNMMKL